ncbi:MAG: 3-deoxy-D-manno-octulosonic acid transferase [Prolixibacteraceae bacterium]|jgi:3-deoxy-D-manno-octulosonic-acid transferase|nr:3-deoxy-D-manno-octulosonic acid transferase [Prolixibacteraceae bacterium]MBT6006576.1 3-deoxy-D-manno-octulosonic acid transferase [Prolixibacteraceae bacterium]MBT6763498.1 3-deoxy-D-manno-octulosonic acid transferase [Prolixibacteraceae bacterium]MBT7000775.1 3-deoxy-D-manno-octulosonic acid transferase [Prolixibacteraceae bacterium]MBT7395522.1 3-deoxy-D-manno-octulosonic acid transferase [Prolixibacteraceae bacterium]
MALLYKIAIFFYSLLIRLASPFNEKAKLFVKGRKNWRETLQNKIEKDAKYLWFHCASLGEFEQGRPVIEEIKKQFPEFKIVLTFFSPSGYEIRKNYNLADVVMYLPVDTKNNAQTFIDIVKPEKVFFIKYEFWYNYINELKKREIPLYIVSAMFRENQQFFKNSYLGNWFRKMLFQFEHFFVQNETSAQLLKNIGLSNVTISGDTRFDRVAAIAKNSKEIPIVEKFKGNSTLIVAGSTWKADEELLVEFINQNKNIKFIIAPHEVSSANINRLQHLLIKRANLFSQINETIIDNCQVLIIDSVGLLSSLYRYGNIAYIGGGFGVGIHNILEAATFGLPVIFGPNYKNFREAVDLKSLGGAFPIKNLGELEFALNDLVNLKTQLEKASLINKNYIAKNVGSTLVIIRKIFDDRDLAY